MTSNVASAKLTVTAGSSSMMVTVVVRLLEARVTPGGRSDPKPSRTLSPWSAMVSSVTLKLRVLLVSPLMKVTPVGSV